MTTQYRRMNINVQSGPCARWGHSMVAVDGIIYLIGGYQNANYFNDLWIFDLSISQFQKHQPCGNLPPPCSSFTLNYYAPRNSLILFAGGTNNKTKLSGLYQLDLNQFKWTQIKWDENVMAPCPRSYHCAEIIDQYLIVFGGEYTQELGDTWIFNLNTNIWREIKSNENILKPKPSKFHSSFVYKNKFYVFGGCKAAFQNLEQVIYLDFSQYLRSKNEDDIIWCKAEFKNTNLLKRWGAVSLISGDYAYVFGGRLKADLQNFVEIDLRQGICSQLRIQNQVPEGRRKPSCCIHNHNLFVFHGYNSQYKSDYGYFQLPYHLPCHEEDKKLKLFSENCEKTNEYINLVNIQQNLPIQKIILSLKPSNDYRYFKNSFSSAYKRQAFTIYPLQQFNDQRRQTITKIFAQFLKCNKLRFNSTQNETIFANTKDLYTLSEYYCIDNLATACKNQLIKLFKIQISQTRELSNLFFRLIEQIVTIDNHHRQYVGFFTVKKILFDNYRMVGNVIDFENLCKILFLNKELQWIHQMVKKYRFQLAEIINGNDPYLAQMERKAEVLKPDLNGSTRRFE